MKSSFNQDPNNSIFKQAPRRCRPCTIGVRKKPEYQSCQQIDLYYSTQLFVYFPNKFQEIRYFLYYRVHSTCHRIEKVLTTPKKQKKKQKQTDFKKASLSIPHFRLQYTVLPILFHKRNHSCFRYHWSQPFLKVNLRVQNVILIWWC